MVVNRNIGAKEIERLKKRATKFLTWALKRTSKKPTRKMVMGTVWFLQSERQRAVEEVRQATPKKSKHVLFHLIASLVVTGSVGFFVSIELAFWIAVFYLGSFFGIWFDRSWR